MDSIPSSPAPNRSKISKTFRNFIHQKASKKNQSNPGICVPIPQEKKPRCLVESKSNDHLERESAEEAMEESKNRAFLAQLFATVSSIKAAYAELQMAQLPYDKDAVRSADQAVVDELKSVSQLKRSRFLKNHIIDWSPPHVTLMLAEIKEQQSLMKIYEITMKKMHDEIENKEKKISCLTQQFKEIIQYNRSLEKYMNASGSFSVLDSVRFSDLNLKDFILVLHYALRSVRNFVKLFIREMESANWDIKAAANAIQTDIVFGKRDHKAFAFESFVCREIFAGFNDPKFSIQKNDRSFPGEIYQRRLFFSEQFKILRSAVSVIHFLKQNPNSLFGKFLKSKYLQLVHPKMEFSFFGNLNQRKMVNSGRDYLETEFFKVFAEMSRRVWLLHCLAFSFEHDVGIFQVKKNSKFSEVYMESVGDDISSLGERELRVAFTVVPGFKFRHTVMQSQVYLIPAKSPAKS